MIEHIIEVEVMNTGYIFSMTGIEVCSIVVGMCLVGMWVYKTITDDDPSIP